jgi:hypothetical protein
LSPAAPPLSLIIISDQTSLAIRHNHDPENWKPEFRKIMLDEREPLEPVSTC